MKIIRLLYLCLMCSMVLIYIQVKEAHCSNYYVDKSGSPSCNNLAVGSETSPWCTISVSINKLEAGDTLYIKNGTYEESFTITGISGTSDSNRITVKAYPGHKPVLRGAGYNSGRIKFSNCNYFTLDGISLTNYNEGLWVEYTNNYILKNSTMYNIGQAGIIVKYNSSYCLIENNTVYNTGLNTGQWGEGIYIGSSTTAQADGTHHITIKNNVIHDTTDEGIELKPGTHDCIIEGNIFYGNGNYGAIEVDEHTAGNQYYAYDPSHIVRNNIIHDIIGNSTAAIRAGTGCLVYNNVIYNIPSPKVGIIVDMVASDTWIRKVYHNTIDVTTSRSIKISGGNSDIKNNIGPSSLYNTPTVDQYYINKLDADYKLVDGSAPIDAGSEITDIVQVDFNGISRHIGLAPDIGAFEYDSGISLKIPMSPQNIFVR